MSSLSRRRFLTTFSTTLAAPLILPNSAFASMGSGFCPPSVGTNTHSDSHIAIESYDYTGAIPGEGPPTRAVMLRSVQLGETYNRTYVENGEYIPEALNEFNVFARDWRHHDAANMDPGLLDIIWSLTEMLGTTAAWNMNSGYRNPASNATVGGARQSYHMRAKAMDITNPQKPPSAVQGAARALAKGGVGTYNSFTHVDTGPVRIWSG